jgi:beta-lactamase class A
VCKDRGKTCSVFVVDNFRILFNLQAKTGNMIGKNNGILKFVCGIAVFISCSTTNQSKPTGNKVPAKPEIIMTDTVKTPALLENLLQQYPHYFGAILKNRNTQNIQIIYTQINRRANGSADLTPYYFNVNADKYFYPASTVKLPIVLLALQKLHELKDKNIDRNSTMLTETAYSGQSAVFNDATAVDGRPTIAHYIKKILMVSDNDAYNRLYEFLGQDYINAELKKKGFKNVQILHRLNVFLTEAENRNTNPIKFYDTAGKLLYQQAAQNNSTKYALRNDSLGNAYYSGSKLLNKPMDFSKKNRLGLEDLNKIVISIVFPDKIKASERFNISEDDRLFVLKYMSQYPTESQYPPYAADTAVYWPAYCKFLYYGAAKTKPNENIRIFNKPGDAYGHMIDAAYIVDYKNKVEFFISAIIYCNNDGILNDDKYDYETVGLPFMKNLGRVIYDYELKRKYKVRPDLSPVLFAYDAAMPIKK